MNITKYLYLKIISTTKKSAKIKTYISFNGKEETAEYITDTDILEDDNGKYIKIYEKKYYLNNIK